MKRISQRILKKKHYFNIVKVCALYFLLMFHNIINFEGLGKIKFLTFVSTNLISFLKKTFLERF